MEDILELEFRNDVSSGVADAHFTQVDDVVFVGKDEHRQSCFRCQRHVTRVEELEKCGEDALTLGLLVKLHLLSHQPTTTTASVISVKSKCIDSKCVRTSTKSWLSLTHHANKSSR